MKEIKHCPNCGNHTRSEELVQTHEDKYLALVNSELNKNSRVWYKCENCTLYYHSPTLDENEEKILYSKFRDRNFRKTVASSYYKRLTTMPDDKSECFQRVEWLGECYSNKDFTKILDVGCGGGILLHYLNRKYPKATNIGLEPNKKYAKVAENGGKNTILHDYYCQGLIKERFDLILCVDVLEHIADIESFWKAAYFNLEKDGVIFIEIPSPYNFHVLDSTHDFLEAQHHYFFGKELLVDIAKRNSFELKHYKQMRVIREDVETFKDLYCFGR